MEGRSYSHRLAVAANQNIKEKNYWLKKLSGNPVKTSFHCDFEKAQGYEAGVSMGTLDFQWTGELFAKLMALSNKFDYTLHIVLVSGLVALLNKYTQTRDILIGSPIYKQEKDIEFINTVLVLRNPVKELMTFKELLFQAKQTVVEATEHQNYPLQVLMGQLNSSGPGSLQTDNTLFDIVLLLENIHDRKYIRDADYRILFSFLRTDETIEGRVEFDAGFYRKDTIERIVRHFTYLVEKAVSNVNTRLEDIDILPEEEKQQVLYDFNDTALPYPEGKTLVRLFEEQAAKTPDGAAVVGSRQGIQLTYKELNGKSNQLAHFLRSRGVTSDTIVGVMKEPSIQMIVALLATLKAGGAYLPIDPKTPANRAASMLEESDAPMLLTERPCLDHFSFRALQNPGLARVKPKVSAGRERITDMDRLPLPDRSLIDYDKYNRYIGYAGVKHTISLEATRGCPYGCTYCHKIFPRRQVSRSAEDIFAEVEYYYNLGVRRFSIIDDIFNLNIKTSSRFFELMIKNGLEARLFFSAGLRGDILTKDYIDLMVEAGTVNMSPALETASPRLQKLIDKNLNIEKFRENIEYICEKYPQVILELFVMHGFPTETEEEARQTLDFVKKLKWVHFPYINILRIYSTTEMAKFAEKHGISFESITRCEDLAWHELPETLPFPKSFTLKYQADFLENYFLCRERLLHVLPYQMQLMTEDELVQKYDSYLPMKIDSFSRLLQVVEIKRSELGCAEFLSEDSAQVPGLNEKLKKDSTAVVPAADALRILLLDLDLYFSQDTEMLYDLVDEPLGLIRLMTQLNLKFGNRIDGRIAKSRIDFDNYRELKKLLEEFKPGLIGIRVLTFYRDFFHKTVSLIRHWGIDVPIIVGGPHVTTNYEEVLQDRNIDLAVLGEGEITLPELVEKILVSDGELPAEEVLSEIPGLAFIPVSRKPSPEFAREIIMLDEAEAILCKESAANPERNDLPGNLAYVIFTSGTTGKPKGAAVEHGNVTANLFAFYREFDIKPTDTVIQLSSYTFDASVEEIYPVLLRGGRLVIPGVNERLDIHKLVEFIVKHNVSIIDCTPLLLNEFNKLGELDGAYVHTFISGGDVLKEEHVGRLLEAGKVYNTYGPTETTVCAAYYRHCGSTGNRIPIGKPIANYSVYILDEKLRLLPVGVIGEICVAGPGVTRGYLNQPELTAEKFLSISYRTYRTNRTYSSQKIYKTGDLGRWLPDGNIEYIGRKDLQVKIRGFRIETGEIEILLKRKAGIKDAVVMAREDKDGEKYLCAYCVSEYDESELKEFLQTELPEFMIPSFFVFLDKFPLTPAGKVDRRALPKPEVRSRAAYMEPQDDLQERVWKIWHDIFDLDRIGIYDNFFEIGGHSLRGIQVVNGIQKEFGVKLAIAEIFKHPTIKELSEVVKDAARQSHSPIEPVEEREYYELSHSQKRVWVVSQFEGGLEAFNIPAAYFLEGVLDRGAFENVFATLVERHESLRTVFITFHGEPKQIIKLPEEIGFKIEISDFSQVKDGEAGAAELADAEENTRFDLACGPLLRAKLLRLEKEKYVFLFNMHHIISDALSIDVLLSEMLTLYEVYRQGGNNSLEPLRIQYRDFAAWQNQQLSETRAQEHKNFWLEHLGGILPVLELPADKERPEVMNYRGDTFSFHLDEKMTRKLRETGQLGGQRDITLFMTLLAALDVLLYGYTGQTDIIVGTTTAGREHTDLENQIGFYLNTLGLRTRINPDDTFIQLLEKIRDVSLASYDHQVYPFDKLVEDLGLERDISRHPIFNVMLNMINYNPTQTGGSIGSLKINPFEAGYHKTKFDLTVYVYEREDTLTVTFEYNIDLFENKTILLMLKRFQVLLNDILEDFSIPISHLLLKDKINLLPITPITLEVDRFDASYHQERLWFIDAFEGGHLYESSPIYHNMPLILKMNGPLDAAILESSIRQVIVRHKALRTRIVTVDNKPVQVVDPAVDFKLNLQVMEGGAGTFAEAVEQAAAESKRPFNLDKEPLIRGRLIRWEHQSFLLVITFHHITADKKSLGLFVWETAIIYDALIHNKNPNLVDLPFHYVDFSRWQSEFSEEVVDTLLFYWRRKLHGKLQALELPTDRPRAKIHTFREARQSFTFPESLTGRLSTYVQQEGVEEFVLLLAAFNVLLHIYCAQDEIIVGTSVDNRHHPGTENMMGPAANLLVLRSFISGRESFKKAVTDLRQTVEEACRYCDMPFDRLVLALNPDIDMSRTALFDVLFRYEEHPFLKISLGDVEAEVVETNLGWGKYDLNVLVQKKASGEGEFLEGVLVYNADYYDASRIRRLIDHYRVLLEAVLNAPQQLISSFEILTPQEKQQLLRKWNGKIACYPQDRQIQEIFEHQAAQNPDHIAVEGAHELHELHELHDISITYSELEKKSNQLAHLLREKGVLGESIVGIMVHRSLEMIIGILGILKAGGAYLPIDPDYPQERIEYMLKDSEAKILLTDSSSNPSCSSCFAFSPEALLNLPEGRLIHHSSLITHHSGHLSYVIYTSGTTGRPKGVMVEHRNVVSLFFNDGFQFDFNGSDIWTMFHSHCFDFSVWEIFGALLYGGKLIVIPKMVARDTEQYVSLVRQFGVTVLNQTPSAFYRFTGVELRQRSRDLQVRYVIFGGEALTPGKLQEWKKRYPHTRLINMFGITETTVHVTYKEITDREIEENLSHIGKTIPTLTSYVMDSYQRLLPVGIYGELYVGGAGVSRGYLNRPQLTAERFPENPHRVGERLYRSGDLVRLLEDGEMVYSGRIDHQVQIRGFRVELGEIQNQLLKIAGIRDAVVVDREDTSGDIYLCAYIVADKTVKPAEARQRLGRVLPDYMIPAYVINVNKIPLTPNGKVDRKALPEPEFKAAGEDLVAPPDALQQKLVEIWADVLNVEKENIGINTSFFDMGGHSLKATILIANIHKELNVKLPLARVFAAPTINELSAHIRTTRTKRYLSIKPVEEKEYYPLSPAQKRLYVLHEMTPDNTSYNILYEIPLEAEVDKEELEATFKRLIRRHEILRTSFEMVEEQPVQRIHPQVDFKIEYYDLITEAVCHYSPKAEVFDLSQAPLVRVKLIKTKTGENRQTLLVDMHHIVTDAASRDIFRSEFMALRSKEELPDLRLQYKDYSEWHHIEARKEWIKEQENYWVSEFSGELPVLNLPTDYSRPAVQTVEGNWVRFMLNPAETGILKSIAEENGVTLFMCLLALFNVLLSKLGGQEDIIVGTPIAARRHADLQYVIGMLVNTLALRNYPSGKKTFKGFLDEIKQRTLEAFENQEYPFEDLVDKLSIHRDTSRNPVFDVMLNVINQSDVTGEIDISGVPGQPPYHHHKGTSRFDISFSAFDLGEHIYFSVEYSTGLFTPLTIETFITYLQGIIGFLSGNVQVKISDIEFIPWQEKEKILEISGGVEEAYDDKTIHRLFEEQVERTPDGVAVVGQSPGMTLHDHPGTRSQHLTYCELNKKSNQLARLLREKGVVADTVVGVMVERSVEMVLALLAVLKAGGAYLPLDPRYPGQRILTMLNDSNVSLLLTTGNLLGQFSITSLKNMKESKLETEEKEELVITPRRVQIKDFDRLPIPDRTLIDYEKYHRYIGEAPAKHTITLQATRGCPYNCLFCHKIWPKTHVARSAENVFKEISYAYDGGVRRFVFVDDIFNLDKRNASEFFEKIIKNRLDIQLFFPNGFRADILTKDFIDLMMEAGTVNLSVALETASPRLQKLIKKNLHLEKFRENVRYTAEKYPHVILEMEIMHGFPTETQEEALMTLDFLESVKWIHFPNLHIVKIFPNTDIYRLAIESGVPKEAIERSVNRAFHQLPDTLPFPKSFTRQCQARFMGEYFLLKERLLHVLPHQVKIMSEDELIQKYDSYLPTEIKRFSDILQYMEISHEELGDVELCRDRYQAPGFCRKIRKHFPVNKPAEDAFKILLLDLSQLFSASRELHMHHQVEEPLGLLYLMTYLNERFKHRIHGKVLKSRIDFDSYRELKRIIVDFKPDLIGIRTLSFYKEFFHQAVLMIRQWGMDVPITSGGPYATSDYRYILQDANVDLVVLGEGEITLGQLVETMMENGSKLPGPEILKNIPGIAFSRDRAETTIKEKKRDILLLDELSLSQMAGYSFENPGHMNRSDNLLYVIHTSGSTGKPKGVMLEHRNLANLILWQYRHTGIDFSRVLQFTTISFDVAAQEIFSTLLAGGQLILIDNETLHEIPELFRVVEREEIKTLFLPASFLKFVFNEEDYVKLVPGGLTHIVTAGEQVIVNERARKYLRENEVYLHNHYGPSETHVVTALTLNPAGDIPELPSIGRPVSNTAIYILDRGMRLVPMGVPGELYIAGAQVGRGYLYQPELTEEKFVFSKKNYKTGDLARWLPDRNLEFLGRLDHQVKIRGFRVELGEIESRLLNHRQIKECVVVSREDEKIGRYLCAYIVSRQELEIPELREYLERDLPDYMVPSYFVFLDEIPLTPNRKVDRKALPAPELEAVDNYIAPESRMEETLVEIWAEVLKIRKEMISVEGNFFELGGHSLTATILAARVHKRFQVKLPLVEIFRVPTIRGLSHYLRDAARDEYAYIEPVEEREYYVLSSAQKRLYILHRMNWSSTAYNMPEIIPLAEYPDLERLESAVKELVQCHESLRTSFVMVNGEPVQRIYPHVEFKIEYHSLERRAESVEEEKKIRREEDKRRRIGEEIHHFVRPFDLSRSPLFRVGLVETVGKKQFLLVDMHHIITDGISNNILKEEFMALYAGEKLASLRLQYKDFVQWQDLRVQQKVLRQQESYWLKEFSGKLPALDLPFDFPRPPQQRFEGNSIYFVMDEENTRQLRDLEVEAGATMYMVILSIYTILLKKLSGQEDIIVGTPTAGRRHADLERIIGMFVNTLPMRNYPLGRKIFIDFLREIKERTTSAFENQEYQFEDLVDRLSIPRDTSRNPIFDTMLNLLYPADYARENRDTPAFDESGLYQHSKGASKFDITLRVFDFGDKLLLNLEYAASLFKPETIDRIIGYFKRIVTSAAGNPGQKIMEIEIIAEEKKREILFQFNEDLRDKHEIDTIQHILFGVFREYGNKTAIEYGAAQITYSELDKKSTLISRWIIHHGIEKGSFIGICMDDKIDIITAMIGILEAGCVFVPLDTRLPVKRIEDMIAAAHIQIIFTNAGGENVLSDTRENNPGIRNIVVIEPSFYMTDELTGFENKAPTARYRREDNVYVYFTSGTGGRPHGIVGKNESLLQFIQWEIDTFAVDETFRVSQLAAVGFDAFLRNVFTPLCAGGTVCIPGTRDAVMDSHGLVDWIDKNRINLVHCVPSVFRLINSEIPTNRRFGHLKYIVMSGEQINPNELKRWYDIFDDRIQLVNCYGATETTIIKTFRFIQKSDICKNRISAGLPIRNTRLIILNDNMNICGRGMVGEIYVRTAYSTSGYLNDPGLNAERFIKNPFGPGAADIIYKTGDLGRELENGEIEILGRVDRQVKIRGLRIELGEIENQLLNHPDVGEAAVTIKEMANRDDDGDSVTDKHLCAYIVPVEGEGKLSGKEKVRYQRQMLLDGWGIGSQERLKSSMVFVAGAGGTGSPTLMQLALCGFGTIVVCDDDVVDLSNLNRQFMHDETRIGMNKALSAKKTIKRINPHINVIAYQEKITRENLDSLAADTEIIFDCVDDLETKFILSEYAAKRKVPHIVSVMIDISSYVAIFHPPAAPCFSCIHDRAKLKDIIEMKKIVKDYQKKPFSVASPSLFVSAGAAVNEALKIILGFENPAYNRFLFFNHKGSAKIVDTEGYRQQTFSFSDHFRNICKEQGFDWDEGWRGNFLEELIITPDINCPVCSKFREDRIDRIDETPLMEDIDVEPEEKEPFAAKYRRYLSGILPDYMIPSFFISIEKIPLTPNGKIDWNALPEPGIGPGDHYTAPGTETEKKLAAIWSEVLGIGVGINDNFFESGGHSLKAAHMIARIHQELRVKLPLAEVFKSPTVKQLAAVISNKEKTSHTDIRGIEEKEFYPLSYNQRRIWLVKQANPNDISYNTTGRITFPHRVDEAVVKRALFKIMARHEGLRTSFREKNGQPVQIIRKSSEINMPLRVVDISALEANEKQQERERIFAEETRTPFDLSRAPLFRTVLVKLGPEQYDFIYTTYHIIADGWSLEVLRKDFLALYQGCRAGQNIEPGPLKVQCKEFAAWQARQLEDPEARESAHRYWRQKLKEDFPPLRLPYDFKEKEDTPGDNDNHGIIYRGVMGKELKEALKALAAEQRTSLFMVMFSLFNLLLARLSGQKDIVCRIPTAGRDHISLQPVVGHLMNPILVRNHVEDNDENNFINLLRRVETNTRGALQHQWYPLERALEDLSAVYPHITVSFNMLNMYEGAAAADLENFDSFHRERVTDERFPLTLQIIEYRNAVELFWRYKNTIFKPGTIEQIAARYNRLIKRVTGYNK